MNYLVFGVFYFLLELKQIAHLQIIGDSIVVIEWVMHKGRLHVVSLESWKAKIRRLQLEYAGLQFQYVYRRFDVEAVLLFKQASKMNEGFI